jgi:cell shape-determining protein MreD
VDFPYALVGLTFWSFSENLSLIPLLGLVSCLYMMAELSVGTGFIYNLVIDWTYDLLCFSRKNSKLNFKEA